MSPMEKKRYHVVRKNRADTRGLLRGLVSAYLLYLGWKLISGAGRDPSFPPALGCLAGGLFAAAALAFGFYAWRQYLSDRKAARLTPEEEAELRREQEAP